jgi:hypothetical protein
MFVSKILVSLCIVSLSNSVPSSPPPHSSPSTNVVTIHNDIPRVDQYGHIVNAHDGSVVYFDGLYFLYGTVYENCTQKGSQCDSPCGYSPNTFSLYTSYDLQSWTFQTANILPNMTIDNKDVNYWMPVVAYNKITSTYVMQYWSGHCGFVAPCTEVATSSSPYGPFTMQPKIPLVRSPSSQMGFFVDSDTGKAYIKFNTVGPDQHHAIQLLTDDWLNSTDEYAIIFWKPSFAWMEGGGLFKRGALYYYMTGTDCCFCTWGGDARFWTSYDPLGPWSPGIAPQLPTERCDVTGDWIAISSSPDAPGNGTLTLSQATGSDNFNFTDKNGKAFGSIDQTTGYVTFPPSAGDHRGHITSADGSDAGCDRIRWYGYESFIWCRVGVDCSIPSYKDAPELNYCQDGSLPDETERINPCDPGVEYGVNFTVPAQQFNVITVNVFDSSSGGISQEILYYGERANSAPDHLFSHNFQAWVPLKFNTTNNAILPLTFPSSFQLTLANLTSIEKVQVEEEVEKVEEEKREE